MTTNLELQTEILQSAKKYVAENTVAPLSFKNVKLYFSAGNRDAFEKEYFARRKQLDVLALAVKLGDFTCLPLLEEVLWHICNEYSWAMPAHLPLENNYFSANSRHIIDLFAAETAGALAEIKEMLAEHLSLEIQQQIDDELEERIFTPFEEKEWSFEYRQNNWSAVIGGNIGLASLSQFPPDSPRLKTILQKLQISMHSYLKSFGEDGGSEEGLSYWAYGFSYYCYFAEKLARLTGDHSYLAVKKIKNIAAAPYHSMRTIDAFVPYSDYAENELPSGLLTFCHDYFKVSIPPILKASRLDFDHCYRFAHLYRNLFWTNISAEKNVISDRHFFSDLQWFIERDVENDFFFSCKGGNNAESHNHNDLGNFVLGTIDDLLITDLGSPEYTRETFDDTLRYKNSVNSSEGHNVPVINGHLQNTGSHAHTTSTIKEGVQKSSATIELIDVYPDELSFKREFDVTSKRREVKIIDHFLFATSPINQVVENFVSLVKPHISENEVTLQNSTSSAVIQFNSRDINFIEKTFINHFGVRQTFYLTQASYTLDASDTIVITIKLQ